MRPVRLLAARSRSSAPTTSDAFRFVLIDEYQDTNQAQYHAREPARPSEHRNLASWATPTRSIYTWRGSDIRNILDFEHDFPDAR